MIQADGGTRTAAITGAFVALADAVGRVLRDARRLPGAPLRDCVAAVSVGVVGGRARARPRTTSRTPAPRST